MSTENPTSIYDLMWAVRKFTRSSLILQHMIAQDIGLNVTDTECMDFLQEMGPSTAGALAKATRLTTGAITNVIDRLEKAGFVKRSADPTDRRKVIVTFVPDKHTNAKIHYAALSTVVAELFSTYTEEQLKFLTDHTNALNEIYQEQALKIKEDK
ncbi:MarR family winged helix-turn-helix transcriptional regulator [Mucilaginibacter agri]|uniref:MarR family transcriptional regulator n=1 Tax=Mucilaginibacter agri TaxID=2695265 RepID=A0A965ZGG8_9SPHI|nr:MarR family transcriptional regulator [Mucilaginibacter agri]NCD70220.1 MarR family transcriptional regulator [Mucilaginibacter agri]